MKKTTYYYLSLFAIMAGSLVACQDDDQGFTEEEVREAVYKRNFVDVFGTPDPNHKWGFDLMEIGGASTRVEMKQDMIWPGSNNVKVKDYFEKAPDITEKEHNEVYAWFKTHKVTWTNTPAYFTTTNNDEDFNAASSTKTTGDNGYARVDVSAKADYEAAGYGSLLNHPENNDKLGDYKVSYDIPIFNGWVQYVANSKSDPERKTKLGNGNYTTAQQMNHLYFGGLNGSGNDPWTHLLDWNGAEGYGYGTQSGQNATLVWEANFNTFAYKSSIDGGNYHDKYIIVYLVGDGYEGWYLGMDLEGKNDTANPTSNMYADADGYCCDWIVKLSAPKPKDDDKFDVRIMCEDLGGTWDYDFNDIVYDVSYSMNLCLVTMRAAGGTIPIEVWYGEKDVTGSVKLMKDNKGEIHSIFGEAVTTPINVTLLPEEEAAGKTVATKNAVSWMLEFNAASTTARSGVDYAFTGAFNPEMLKVYVQSSKNAEWIDITNKNGEAPLRFCVDKKIPWTKECQNIKELYTGFETWVGDRTRPFWQ